MRRLSRNVRFLSGSFAQVFLCKLTDIICPPIILINVVVGVCAYSGRSKIFQDIERLIRPNDILDKVVYDLDIPR